MLALGWECTWLRVGYAFAFYLGAVEGSCVARFLHQQPEQALREEGIPSTSDHSSTQPN